MESTSTLSRQHSVGVGWRFWLQWVLANTFGFGIGFPLGIIPFLLLTEGHTDIPFRALVGSLGWIVVGAFVGIMQWLALRPVLSDARWIVATITGWAAGVGISAVLPLAGMPAALPPLGMAGLALAYGAGAGVLQTLVLRCSAPRAVAWVLVSAAGWALVGVLDSAGAGIVGTRYGCQFLREWGDHRNCQRSDHRVRAGLAAPAE